MEVTALCVRLMVEVLLLFTAQAQNRHNVHKADAAFLHIDPNRLQFFEYESVSLHCAGFEGSTAWRVMRNNSSNETSAGRLIIKPAYGRHSGEYWCENGDGERSNTVSITVTGGDVILESPSLPVMEQQDVTLRCRKKADESKLSADFFRDGRDIGIGFTGETTISNISKSHEGRYKCRISGVGESAESWLTVTEDFTPAFQVTTPQEAQQTPRLPPYSGSNQLSIPLMVVFIVLCVAVLVLVLGLLQCRKHGVACFSSKMPTTGSEAVYEQVIADPRIATYASVEKPKKNRGCRAANVVEDPNDVTYAVVTAKKKKKKRATEEANVPDPNKSTYAVVALQRRERGH